MKDEKNPGGEAGLLPSHEVARSEIAARGDLNDDRAQRERVEDLRRNRMASIADNVAAFAHDVAQPLTVASNYLSAARRLVGSNAEAAAAIERAATHILKAGRLLARAREFVSRPELEEEAQSLHSIIRHASELVAPAFRRADVELTLTLEAADDAVLVEDSDMVVAMVEIMRAALDHCHHGVATVATSRADGAIRADVFVRRSADQAPPEPAAADLSLACSIIAGCGGRVHEGLFGAEGQILSFALPLAADAHE
jgi:phosphoglycerate-specific signal transduction histidine kinase